ncbi:MAG: alpha/beta hydrolase [Spirochaetia bacterium]|nr:alpha/beta hydrolase [Spirochaetia bacterium]
MVVLIIMILTLTLFSLYINKREKRSATSFVSEKVLRRLKLKNMHNDESSKNDAYLAKRMVKNEEPYTLPIKNLAHCKVELTLLDDIQTIIFTPRKRESKATIFYLHGGGYVEHASIVHYFFIDAIQKKFPCRVIMPLYPKAPAHHAKTSVDKMKTMYLHVKEESKEPTSVIGDSAGGGLALAVMQQVVEQPKEIILISPWLDISLKNPLIEEVKKIDPLLGVKHLRNMGNVYRGELEERDQRVSPLFGEISPLAPLTLFVGTHEIFLPDARLLKERCEKEGKEVLYIEKEKMMHVYPLFPMKEGKEAVAIIVGVLER